MELNFEGLEIQKWNIPTDRSVTVRAKYFSAPERSYLALLENDIDFLVLSSTPETRGCQYIFNDSA